MIEIPATLTARHATARRYAAAGIPIFPCGVNSKKPATTRGLNDATTDISAIDKWWSENDYNIGVVPENAGWCVVDLDLNKAGPEHWLAIGEDKPDTYTVATPGGGRHLYYMGSLPPSAGKLAPGIDTRGRGSYVLAPSSVIDGNAYVVVDDRDPAPLPEWIAARLGAAREHQPAPVPENITLDDAAAVAWAIEEIRRDLGEQGDPVEGEASDPRTYEFVNHLLDGPDIGHSLSEGVLIDLLADRWAPHFDREWIEAKVASAIKHRQNPPGCAPAGSPIRKYGDPAQYARPSLADQVIRTSRFAAVLPSAAATRAPPVYWDAHKLFLRQQGGSVSMIYAAFSNFKSTWSANYAISIAKETGARALYVLGEGAGGFAPLTLAAALQSWNEDHADDPLTWDWLDEHVHLVETMPQILSTPDMTEFVEAHRDWSPDLVFLDTLGSAAAGENLSAIEIGTAIGRAARTLATELAADVMLLHHEGKNEKAMGSQYIVGNDPDMVLHLAHTGNQVVVTVNKDRWGERNRKVYFGVRRLMLGDREFVATYELRHGEQQAPDHTRRVYQHIMERLEAGERTGRDNRADYGPAAVAHALGLDQREVDRAMSLCRAQGWLTYEKGPPPGWAAGHVTPLREDAEAVY